MVLAGIAAGIAVGWFSAPGQQFLTFAQESIAEVKKMVWPTRKESFQTAGAVFAFVVLMALFLWIVDKSARVRPVRPHPGLETIMTKRWYVVHAYSGFEKSVQRALEDRIRRAGMQDKFGKILVPTEEVVEMKGGQKNISERKFFPGYVLVEMEMDDEAWHLVKNTPKVTGLRRRRARAQAAADQREGSRSHPAPDAGGRREAQAQGAVRGGRSGARQGRALYRLSRQWSRT